MVVVVVAVVDGEDTSSGQMMHSAGQGVGDAPERLDRSTVQFAEGGERGERSEMEMSDE